MGALLTGLYAVIPAMKEQTSLAAVADLPAEIHAAFTLVLGWLLVFRTNSAYQRWWEARTLWGQLVNTCRNVSVKLTTLGNIDDSDLREVQRLILQFPVVLKNHLRNAPQARPGNELTAGETLAADTPTINHLPSDLVQRMYLQLSRWKAIGRIDANEQRIFDHDLSQFLHICGGCERIRNTLTVRSYRVFVRQCIFLFLLTFPWGIANDFQWWTIPLTIIIAYFMLGLESVAEVVEEPFGDTEDDLDLDGLCTAISRSVTQIFERKFRGESGATPSAPATAP